VPGVQFEPSGEGRVRADAVTIRLAGRVTAGFALEESPDTAGQDAGATQAAKADGQWHRKETASGELLSGDAEGKGEKVG
jgi:hypothetical protein